MSEKSLLSHSELQCFQRCPREHHFRYRLLRRPQIEEQPLAFGKLVDESLQAWWEAGPLHGYDAMMKRLEEMSKERLSSGKPRFDPFDVEKARALLIGYSVRWENEPYEVIRVQPVFRMPIINPNTNRPSQLFELGGKLDVLVRDIRTDEIVIIETKTTSYDIAPEASYWHTISALDPQVSTYWNGARKILSEIEIRHQDGRRAIEAQRCIYDVIRKPDARPYKATPAELRQYTQPKKKKCPECKKKTPGYPAPHHYLGEVLVDQEQIAKQDQAVRNRMVLCHGGEIVTDPGGRLYASQRAEDETPAQYFDRLAKEITDNPNRFYARGDIVRLEQDEIDHAQDVWDTAKSVRDMETSRRAPRYRGSCRRFGRLCSYLPVCMGVIRIEDIPQVQEKHEELGEI